MRRPFPPIPPDRRAARLLGSTARRAESQALASATDAPVAGHARAVPAEVQDDLTASMGETAVRAATGDGARAAVQDGTPAPELAPLLAQLRAALAALVVVLREEGQPIERVIPRGKALVREAARAERWAGPSDVLVAQVVRWTVETYYDRPGGAGVSPSR